MRSRNGSRHTAIPSPVACVAGPTAGRAAARGRASRRCGTRWTRRARRLGGGARGLWARSGSDVRRSPSSTTGRARWCCSRRRASSLLKRGAAERLGIPWSATRRRQHGGAMATILETVRTSAVVRRDVLAPFAETVARRGAPIESLRWIAISEAEGAPAKADAQRYAAEWKRPVRRCCAPTPRTSWTAIATAAGSSTRPETLRVDHHPRGRDRRHGAFRGRLSAVRYNLGPGSGAAGLRPQPSAIRVGGVKRCRPDSRSTRSTPDAGQLDRWWTRRMKNSLALAARELLLSERFARRGSMPAAFAGSKISPAFRSSQGRLLEAQRRPGRTRSASVHAPARARP